MTPTGRRRSGPSTGSSARFVAAALILASFGCAYKPLTHTPGLIHTAGAQASSPAAAPDVSLSLDSRYLSFGSPLGPSMEKWWAKQQMRLRSRTEEIRMSMPLFSAARWDAPEAPYRLALEATFDTRGSKTRYTLTDLSKYLIPSSDEGVVWVRARVYRKGGLLKEYEAEGTYRTRRHAIFLLMPMLWRLSVPGRVAEDTIRDALLMVERDAATLFAGPE